MRSTWIISAQLENTQFFVRRVSRLRGGVKPRAANARRQAPVPLPVPLPLTIDKSNATLLSTRYRNIRNGSLV